MIERSNELSKYKFLHFSLTGLALTKLSDFGSISIQKSRTLTVNDLLTHQKETDNSFNSTNTFS